MKPFTIWTQLPGNKLEQTPDSEEEINKIAKQQNPIYHYTVMIRTRYPSNTQEFKQELPFTIEEATAYTCDLSIYGTTSTNKIFSLVLDLNWEIFIDNQVCSWDNEEISKKVEALKGKRILEIAGPHNFYDATYQLEDGGSIRSVTSSDRFGSDWALRIADGDSEIMIGEIDPYLALDEKTNFCSWDAGSKEISCPPIGLHSQLIGASVTSLCVHNENVHEILDNSLKTLDSQELHLCFYNSWALYTESELLVAGQMDEYFDRFAQIAIGGVLERFTNANDLGFYGCSLNFSSMTLRQVGSSEPVWAWRILDDKGNLLWRAPVDAEVNRGLIDGVENPVL